jgi:hypothetical protein
LKKASLNIIGREINFLQARHTYASIASTKMRLMSEKEGKQYKYIVTAMANHEEEAFDEFYNDDFQEDEIQKFLNQSIDKFDKKFDVERIDSNYINTSMKNKKKKKKKGEKNMKKRKIIEILDSDDEREKESKAKRRSSQR